MLRVYAYMYFKLLSSENLPIRLGKVIMLSHITGNDKIRLYPNLGTLLKCHIPALVSTLKPRPLKSPRVHLR